MARSRASSKAAGTKYETAVARYLHDKTGQQVIRMPKFGASDRGDIFGVTKNYEEVTVECKSPGQDQSYKIAKWMRELQAEKDKSLSCMGVLLIKQFRKKIGQSLAVMDEHDAQFLGIDVATAPVCSTRSFLNWYTFVDEHTFVRFPVRGDKGNNYVVTYLDTIVDMFDKRKNTIVITMSHKYKEAISAGEVVTVKNLYPGAPTIILTPDADLVDNRLDAMIEDMFDLD